LTRVRVCGSTTSSTNSLTLRSPREEELAGAEEDEAKDVVREVETEAGRREVLWVRVMVTVMVVVWDGGQGREGEALGEAIAAVVEQPQPIAQTLQA
jgi:hypothetical protein